MLQSFCKCDFYKKKTDPIMTYKTAISYNWLIYAWVWLIWLLMYIVFIDLYAHTKQIEYVLCAF